jgi:murein L,D-transpeptidase YcbB/YkuD
VLGLAAWACACAPAPRRGPNAGPPPIEDEIEQLTARGAGGLADTAGAGSAWTGLGEFYRQRHFRPAWSNGRRARGQAKELIEALRHTAEAGLDPRDYDLEHLERLLALSDNTSARAESLRGRTLARFEVLATFSLLRAADQLREGRIPRAALDPDWVLDSLAGGGQEAIFRTIGHDPSHLFADREPKQQGYRQLRDVLARYRAIATAGGWREIPAGPPLALGARGPRVADLVRRLAATGDFRPTGPDTVFDRRLEQAVGSLQARLGIPVSGVLGEATRAALNVSTPRRIRQIELNLERWRWLPDTLGRRHVEINIPAYRLALVRDDHVTRAMRVVVGKRRSPTPVFSDRITYVEINPTWTLPPSVVVKEIVPALKRNKHYLEQNHMLVIEIADAKRDTVEPRKVPWKDAASDSFLFLVVQEAGPENPLGQIKLMCPNEYDVYLHDSPLRSRFTVAVRDYSHGCVRVEHATELADSLLRLAPQDTIRTDSLVALGGWRRVSLRESVPVHFLYWTAWVDENGQMCFRDDLYGLDERLDAALRSRRVRDFVLNPGVAVSPFWAAQARALDAAAAREAASRTSSRRR